MPIAANRRLNPEGTGIGFLRAGEAPKGIARLAAHAASRAVLESASVLTSSTSARTDNTASLLA